MEKKEKEVSNFIDGCIKDNILKDFLTEHKEEVIRAYITTSNQIYLMDMKERDVYNESREKGRKKGRKEGKTYILDR